MTELASDDNMTANVARSVQNERVTREEKRAPALLFLCHRIPYPPNKGEKIRAFHVLSHLARSHAIHLGCLVDDAADLVHVDALRDICASIGCFTIRPFWQRVRAVVGVRPDRPLTADIFYSRGLARWIDDTLSREMVRRIFVFSSGMAGYAIGRPGEIRVFDMADVDSEKWQAYSQHHHWPMAAIYRREARTLLALERQAALNFDTTLFVSEAEAARFATLAPESRDRIRWLDNGVDLETFSPHLSFDCPFAEATANIVFTGTMDYWPNVDAVVWFAERVLPALRQRRPAIQFHVVGAKPSGRVLQLRQLPAVNVTGWVPDVRPFLAHADVAVAPLRVARGTQNKVLEAMAMGRPVIATPEAFEGLRAVPGRDLLLCSDPEEMVQRIIEILDGRHPSLGIAARRAVEHHYRWAETLAPLDDLFPPEE